FLVFLALALLVLVLEAFVGEFVFMGLSGALVIVGGLAWAFPDLMSDGAILLLGLAAAWLVIALACRAAFGSRTSRKEADRDPNEY
ncbi:MAG: hypothetical protein AAFU61_08520, partial [Pseudomonadota bacterium]